VSHDDFAFEPRGLPAALPAGERLLWQGSPSVSSLAIHAFHVRKAAGYFGFLVAWRAGEMGLAGASAAEILPGCAWLAFLGGVLVGLLSLLAWASARNAVYTITTRRVVIRHGVALQLSLNVPFSAVEGAGLLQHRDGSGDVALQIEPRQRVVYLLTWPFVRRWQFAKPQPMLRSLESPAEVAKLLTDAWRASQAGQAAATAQPGVRGTRAPSDHGPVPAGVAA
jgi:hypothetical protein